MIVIPVIYSLVLSFTDWAGAGIPNYIGSPMVTSRFSAASVKLRSQILAAEAQDILETIRASLQSIDKDFVTVKLASSFWEEAKNSD